MERKLKILKAVLLWRRTNRYQTKEEQIADVEKNAVQHQTGLPSHSRMVQGTRHLLLSSQHISFYCLFHIR